MDEPSPAAPRHVAEGSYKQEITEKLAAIVAGSEMSPHLGIFGVGSADVEQAGERPLAFPAFHRLASMESGKPKRANSAGFMKVVISETSSPSSPTTWIAKPWKP